MYIESQIDPKHVGVQHLRMLIERRRPQRAEALLSHFPHRHTVWCSASLGDPVHKNNEQEWRQHTTLPKTKAYSKRVRLTAIDSSMALTIIV